MRDMMIPIDKCDLMISTETCARVKSWASSLSSHKDGGITVPGTAGTVFFISYDESLNEIRIYQLSNHFFDYKKIEYAKINFMFSGSDVLEFSFKYREYLYIKDDEYSYFDRSGFFKVINDILGYEAFKIYKENK